MNGVTTIFIDGQTVRLKFGLPAVRRIFQKMEDLSADFTVGPHYSDIGLSHILFAGYLNGCMQKDEPPSLTYEDFYEMVEDARFDEALLTAITDAIRVFEESRFVKRTADVAEKEEEKKRQLTGMN